MKKFVSILIMATLLLLPINLAAASTKNGITTLVSSKGDSVDVSVKNINNKELASVRLQPQIKSGGKWVATGRSFDVRLKGNENKWLNQKHSMSGTYRYEISVSRGKTKTKTYSSQFNIK